jgi:hypothetical protein
LAEKHETFLDWYSNFLCGDWRLWRDEIAPMTEKRTISLQTEKRFQEIVLSVFFSNFDNHISKLEAFVKISPSGNGESYWENR